MAYYQAFCGCMSSQTGVKLISILTIMIYVLYLVAVGLYGFLHGLQVETTVAEYNETSISDGNGNPDGETSISDTAILYCIYGMSTFYKSLVLTSNTDIFLNVTISVIVCIIGIMLNVMLLIGSEGKRRFFILPWLIMTMFHLVVSLEANGTFYNSTFLIVFLQFSA